MNLLACESNKESEKQDNHAEETKQVISGYKLTEIANITNKIVINGYNDISESNGMVTSRPLDGIYDGNGY